MTVYKPPRLSVLDIDWRVLGVVCVAELLLTDSFHINEGRGIDFMEPARIDLWLPSTFYFNNIISTRDMTAITRRNLLRSLQTH